MPKPKLAYEINDALSTEDNLLALGSAIDALDPALSEVLKPKLVAWASGELVDPDAIWDALYAATAPQPLAKVGHQA